MKKFTVCFMAVIFTVMMVSASFAAGAPELRGTWRGDTKLYISGQFQDGKVAYVINEQKDQVFAGYKMWFTKNGVLAKEKFAGIYDGGEIMIAESIDGMGFGYLTGRQNMTIKYLENGTKDNKVILCKLERVHFTTGFVEIDKDGNNIVMRAEVTNHYPLNAERIMKEADANGDGKLTKKEWEAWKKANDWE